MSRCCCCSPADAGDVPRDLRRTDDPAFSISDRRDRQRCRLCVAILALPNGLVVFDALAATNAAQNGRLLVMTIRWNEHGDRLADRFVSRIAEQRSAPRFQLLMILLRSFDTTASSEDLTMAARSR